MTDENNTLIPTTSNGYLDLFPREIWFQIFNYSSTISLINLKSTNKNFCKIIEAFILPNDFFLTALKTNIEFISLEKSNYNVQKYIDVENT